MRQALLATSTAAALLTPLGACGGDDGETITDPGTWLDTYVARLCAKVHACAASYVPTGGETFEEQWGATEAACKAIFLTADQVRTSVASGRAVFDADAGRDCLAMLGFDDLSCPEFWDSADPAVCRTVYRGTVAAGGACAISLECVSGFFCIDQTCQMPQ
jgi:hypothetical protein